MPVLARRKQEFRILLLNSLGVMAALAAVVAYFSLDSHHHCNLLKILCLGMGCKIGVTLQITLQGEASLRCQPFQKQDFQVP